jgi:hypothetical protein
MSAENFKKYGVPKNLREADSVAIGLSLPTPPDASGKMRFAPTPYSSQVVKPLGEVVSWQERETEDADDPLSSSVALNDEQAEVCWHIKPTTDKLRYRRPCAMLLNRSGENPRCLIRAMQVSLILPKDDGVTSSVDIRQGTFFGESGIPLAVASLVALGQVPSSCEVGGYKVQLADSTLATSGPSL